MKLVSASDYNLPSRVILRAVDKNHIAIVKLIKSRIIQKDAAKIVEIARQIQSVDADMKVSLVCSSAICSKSLTLLKNEGVGVIIEKL